MFYYIFNLIITCPIIEWIVHSSMHDYNNVFHYNHHIEVRRKTNEKEYYLLLLIYFFYLTEWNILCMTTVQYLVNHTLIHFYPQYCFKGILQHHLNHHTYNNYNFAVSNPYIDTIFGTRYIK